mmetsp:Transcript_61165/g.171104  ORF Transcript_61165/g.171104 Transcript_61165/m.171104 type:complete len:92 (-) Transcript_61165:546-821(-)
MEWQRMNFRWRSVKMGSNMVSLVGFGAAAEACSFSAQLAASCAPIEWPTKRSEWPENVPSAALMACTQRSETDLLGAPLYLAYVFKRVWVL